MGTGSPQEAEFTLVADVPAGDWRFVGDGIITRPVDVTFELIWRKASGGDVAIATFMQHFEPLAAGFTAQPYEATMAGAALTDAAGDQLILRYSGANTDTPMAYIPNGDGFRANGRIPYVDLPE